jgi:DNA mismatch endonuclease, patch repair protein
MVDVFSKKKRSQVMSQIRGHGNKDTELALVTLLRQEHITGWRRHQALLGKPDFTFRRERLVIFVDGCFWHCCPKHFNLPENNREFWQKKLGANRQRDKLVTLVLRKSGWRVLRIWEHEFKYPDRVIRRVRTALAKPQTRNTA